MAATWQVIANEGLEAATFRRIAKAAACTTGLVTHYFRSKEDVLISSLEHVFATGTRRVLPSFELPPLEALEATLLDCLPLDAQRILEWRVWLVFWGQALTSERLVEIQREQYSVWHSIIETLLNNAAAAGFLDPQTDVAFATKKTIALVDGLGIRGVFDPTATTQRLIRFAVKEHIEALKTGSPLFRPNHIAGVSRSRL